MRKNIFKATLVLLAALFAGSIGVIAQSNYAESDAWTIKYTPRESIILGNGGVQFPIRTYSVAQHGGGTIASNTIILMQVPTNFIFTQGWVDVITPIEPNTNNTYALSVVSYGDILQEQSNTFSTAGIYSLLTTNAPIKTAGVGSTNISLTLNGTITQGVFKVLLGGYLSQ